jgi:Mrp family chromosome partitioning ATPase
VTAPAAVSARPDARVSAPFLVVVFNQKGGVGKSLLSMALAAVTSDTNGTAYLVDIDPQSTTAEVAIRAERAGTPLRSPSRPTPTRGTWRSCAASAASTW